MREPKKIKLSDFISNQKEPSKIPLEPSKNIEHLYDEFGYVLTIESKNEDYKENNP